MKYQVNRSTGDAYEEHYIEGTLTQVLVVLDALGMSKEGEIIPCSLDNTEQWEDGTLGASEEHAVLASEEDTREVRDTIRAAKQKIPDWLLSADVSYSRIPLGWEHAWIAQDMDGAIFAYAVPPIADDEIRGWNFKADDLSLCKCLHVQEHGCLIKNYKSHCFQYF